MNPADPCARDDVTMKPLREIPSRITMRFVALMRGALVGLLLALCYTASADAQAPDATLPSKCLDQQVAPLSVILTCADAGFIAHDLVWRDWGTAQASATGTATVKTCDPDCASGGTEDYAVELSASELRDCAYGKPQYSQLTYRFPGASPFPPGSPGAEDPTVGFPCPKRRHADPRIRSMKMRSTGHHAGGDDYFVRVHITLRVCAIRGRSRAVLNETKRVGGQTFGEHTRTIRFRQRSACQSHRFSWKLRDEFFGIGTYRVAATVWDADSQFSKTVSRRSVTTD